MNVYTTDLGLVRHWDVGCGGERAMDGPAQERHACVSMLEKQRHGGRRKGEQGKKRWSGLEPA